MKKSPIMTRTMFVLALLFLAAGRLAAQTPPDKFLGHKGGEARKLAKEVKAIVLIPCSLHATEIAASQMSMELAYDLVTGRTFFDAGKILNDVVVLLVPSHHPDGNQMVADGHGK